MEGEGQREGQGSVGWSTEVEAAAVTNTSRRGVTTAKTVAMSTEQHPGEVCGLEEQRGE